MQIVGGVEFDHIVALQLHGHQGLSESALMVTATQFRYPPGMSDRAVDAVRRLSPRLWRQAVTVVLAPSVAAVCLWSSWWLCLFPLFVGLVRALHGFGDGAGTTERFLDERARCVWVLADVVDDGRDDQVFQCCR